MHGDNANLLNTSEFVFKTNIHKRLNNNSPLSRYFVKAKGRDRTVRSTELTKGITGHHGKDSLHQS